MKYDFMSALDDLRKEHGLDKDTLLEAIESAVKSAYRRNYGGGHDVKVEVDRESGSIRIRQFKEVVEEVTDERQEISLAEARRMDPSHEVGDRIGFEVAPGRFGRIAAQTSKQVIMQRVREAQRERIYQQFIDKEGEMITGLVQRVHNGNVLVDLGATESILEPSEQIPGERFSEGDRVKLYIAEVNKTTKGPQIVLSRSHPQLVKRLLELEVPEVHDGEVEIVKIVRESGARSKVAVRSEEANVDPVGACVGQRGARVQSVVRELKGEKVDIVRWSPVQEDFVANSLSPADVSRVILQEKSGVARVVVPDDQLSLAIGKAGQNARLSAKLTGWKIDIESESEWQEKGGEEGIKVSTEDREVRVPGFLLRDEEEEDRPSRLIDRMRTEATKEQAEDAQQADVEDPELQESEDRPDEQQDEEQPDEQPED